MDSFYFVTHDMGFHTDEVLAYSIYNYTFDDKIKLELIRTRKYIDYENDNCILVDIGNKYIKNKYYDHHQNDSNLFRNNGIKFSSAGLIWKDFGEKYIEKYLKEKYGLEEIDKLDILDIFYEIDKKFIIHVDLVDNGKFISQNNTSITSIDKMYYPPLNERTDEKYLEGFLEYSDFLSTYLQILIDTAFKRIDDRNLLFTVYDNSDVLFIEDQLLWRKTITNNHTFKNLKVVINKMEDGTWRINPIKEIKKSDKFKVNFPQQWLGLSEDKLKEVSGIDDILFCHSSGYTAGAKTKEACIKIYELMK
jgi:uncharacterized UPF0160 family protein